MNIYNLHTHTSYSDGQNTPEEMVREAIRLGLTKIGFSDHSFVSFDPDYCMQYETYAEYQAEIARLKEQYRDSIKILTGIEQDYYSDDPAEGFDYIIGSVHYILCDGDYICVDFSGEQGAGILFNAAERYFGGDIYALLEQYYETVGDVVRKTGADLIGHFDIICKSNCAGRPENPTPEGSTAAGGFDAACESVTTGRLFDPSDPRYVAAWKRAADRLLSEGVPFEINLSKIINGIDDEPYPSRAIISYLRENGAKLIYTGDSHSLDQLRAFKDLVESKARAYFREFISS